MNIYSSVVKAVSAVVGGNMKKMSTKIAPARSSISGYCHDILLLHLLQAPLWKMKLNSGISSFHVSCLPHDMHLERPPTVVPVLKRKATTLRKLPMTVPKMKTKTSVRISILIGNGDHFGPMQ